MDGKKCLYIILRFVVMAFHAIVKPFKIVGREKVPEGAAVVCANHTSFSDPFYMAFAIPPKYHLCLMAKQELFKFKPLGWLLRGIGTFPVNRESAGDMEAMKNALRVLKAGKKLGIFPEGTRTEADGSVSPKAGAVMLAKKTGAPILPIYIPRKKKIFRRNIIVVGDPVKMPEGKLSREEMEKIADDIMDKIAKLGHNIPEKGRA